MLAYGYFFPCEGAQEAGQPLLPTDRACPGRAASDVRSRRGSHRTREAKRCAARPVLTTTAPTAVSARSAGAASAPPVPRAERLSSRARSSAGAAALL